MEVSSVSSSQAQVLNIYAEKLKSEGESSEKLALINMEQKMKAEEMELAVKALGKFFA